MLNNIKDKKILINNVVPLNNGDVALFSSLFFELRNENYDVKIATYNYSLAKKLYPQFPFVKELGQSKLFIKLPFLKPILLPLMFFLSKDYREADIIIGTPGGYINSFYNIKNTLSTYKIAKYFGKKTAIYAQSVGPLNKKDDFFFKELMNHSIDFIFARDQFSLKQLERLQIDESKYKLTKDAAFLLKYRDVTSSSTSKKVAISVRDWNFEDNNITKFKNTLLVLIKEVIKNGFHVDFLSTCQGVKNYKDDSLLAQKTFEELTSEEQQKCTVISKYFPFEDFYKKLEEYNFVIGTRLHMCITSLIKNIPAFNISYEVKGKECYSYLDMLDYTIPYNCEIDIAKKVFSQFMDEKEVVRKKLKVVIPKIHQEVKQDFKYFINRIIE